MANLISVRLSKGDGSSWGFRLQGGKDFGTPLVIQKVNGGSPAEKAGLRSGDAVIRINNIDVLNLRHKDAQDVILRAGLSFEIAVQRGGLTWKPAVSPVGNVTSPKPTHPVNSVSPVTTTSLATGRKENIGAIGTSHNTSAKPFNTVNGGPALVNKQYNSPLHLYSEQSIAETLSAQSEVLSNGVVGVNFKKNEKSYDSTNSAVFRMVQEADKEPRDYYEPEVDTTGVVTAPLGVVGLRHVKASEPKPVPPPQQLPPGQNICADCERLIVGVFVRIKDKNLHIECFKCATCGTSLKNVGYYNINNKLYCDVHAKLAVKNNPPAPNLVPVTIQPGGKIPSGTISAALASHSLPSSGPLSPNPNYTPTYQPVGRPFSSGVSAPISPTNSLPNYSISPVISQPETHCIQNTIWPPPPKEPELPTASPLYFPPPSQVNIPQKLLKTEEPDYSEPDDMSYKTPFSSMEILNISGRGMIESSETVSESIETKMLVDSVLKSHPRSESTSTKPSDVSVSFIISESELKKGGYNEVCQKKYKDTMNPRENATQSCTNTNKTDSNYIQDEQFFSHSKNQVRDSEHNINLKHKTTVQKQEIHENKICLKQEHTQNLSSMYEKAIKVENTVPHKWESPLVVALTVAPDRPYSPIPSEPDLCLPLPPKRSASALAAALVVAPASPFTPVPHISLEPVPLPEYMEPYLPPERPIITEPKNDQEPDTNTVQNPKISSASKIKKKATPDSDKFLEDLPKPTGKMTMLAALTTAPNRPYSPFSQNEEATITSETFETELAEKEETVEVLKIPEAPVLKKNVFPKPEPCAAIFTAPERLYSPFTANRISYESETHEADRSLVSTSSEEHSIEKHDTKNIQTTENITSTSTGCPPLIHCIRSSFETKTDKVHMEMSCAFPCEPVTTKRLIEKKTDTTEEKLSCNKQSSQQHSLQNEKVLQKDVRIVEQSVSDVSQNQNINQESIPLRSVEAHGKCAIDKQQSKSATFKQGKNDEIAESTLIQQACSRIQNIQHIEQERETPITAILQDQTNLSIPQIAFQTVNGDTKSNTTFSPRPVTPSMINKPASILPYYQANLVAIQQPAAEGSIYDPKSPVSSRTPSPYPGRTSSPLPSAVGRAISPAPGPPPNPLMSSMPIATIIHSGKVDQARDYVQSYIPQHKTADITGSLTNQASTFQQHPLADDITEMKFKSNPVQSFKICNVENSVCGSRTTSSQSIKNNESQLQSICKKEKICEKSNLAREVLQTSDNGMTQIQRRKIIAEEYEHNQNSMQLEKYTNSSKICVTGKNGEAGVLGMHVTNPQPIKSPFIEKQKQIQTDLSQIPALHSAIPKLTKTAPVPKSSSNVNVKPSVSQPNAGTGGGRQAGAVGVAPKRGRGVLNLAATPGSRVPVCAHCHTTIRGPFITALGKLWCPEHFSCTTPSCRRALQDLGFVEEQGQLYCEFCFEKYLAPLCAKCNTKVKGDCLKAIGKTFHPECFSCTYCGKMFGNSPFFLEDAQPYCENDWNELFTTKCFACGFPVEAGDRWVEALNNNYHSQCFNCTMCKKNLEGQSFFAKGGRPYCKTHAR